tara:strand:+ start:12271 stop:12450 length:180 start_codon:yes stop_codon:yes gene_type:complete
MTTERHQRKASYARAVSEYNRAGVDAAVAALGAGDAEDWTQDSPEDAKRRLRAEKEGRE